MQSFLVSKIKTKWTSISHQTRPGPTGTIFVDLRVSQDRDGHPGYGLTTTPDRSLFPLLTVARKIQHKNGKSQTIRTHTATHASPGSLECVVLVSWNPRQYSDSCSTFERGDQLNPIKAVVSSSYLTQNSLLNEHTLKITSAFSISKHKQKSTSQRVWGRTSILLFTEVG